MLFPGEFRGKGLFASLTPFNTSNFSMTPRLWTHHRKQKFWLCLCTQCK